MLIDAKAAIVERTNGLGSPDAVFFSSVGHKDYFLRMFRQYPKIEKEIGIDACRYLTSDVLSSLLLVGTKKRHVILVCDSKFDPVDRAMAVVHITF
jgi:hypothetical protein